MSGKNKTLIQTMIAILVSGSLMVGTGWIASKYGKKVDVDVDFSKNPSGNKAPTVETTAPIEEDTTLDSTNFGTSYEEVPLFPMPDDADKEEVGLDSEHEINTDQTVGGGTIAPDTLTPEVTLAPETTVKPVETTAKPVDTTKPVETTAPVVLKTYNDMLTSINTALKAYYKAEGVLDVNYQANLTDVFAVVTNNNRVTTYALGKLPATNSQVVVIFDHSSANASKINASSANAKNWKGEGYSAYCDSLDGSKINSYSLGYVVEMDNDKIVYYETAKPTRVNNSYEYQANKIAIDGKSVASEEIQVVSTSKLSKSKLIDEIKIAVNGTANEIG